MSTINKQEPWNKREPWLYHKGRSGVVYKWTTWADDAYIFTAYGQLDGKMSVSRKKAEPKNVGKANETTPDQQAELEVEALYKFKLDRKYSTTIEGAKEDLLLPMLAPNKPFADMKKYVKYPCHAQPKLDGVRCLAYRESMTEPVILISRSGKLWNLPHISGALDFLKVGDMVDGEIYIHGVRFQKITKLIKSKDIKERERLQLHIYDVPESSGRDDYQWRIREMQLSEIIAPSVAAGPMDALKALKIVKKQIITCEEDVDVFQMHCVELGYEGSMLRMLDGMYEYGYRSKSLIKVKTSEDHEYKIVGFTDGKGKAEGAVMWTCQMENGVEFDCTPSESTEERRKLFKEGATHIGKFYKVKHWGYTNDGIPRCNIGVGFRDEMDMSKGNE